MVMVIVLSLVSSGAVVADPIQEPRPVPVGPANDDVADAIDVFADDPVVMSTSGATLEPGEPQPGCWSSGAGASAWFRYVPERSEHVWIETDRTHYLAVLDVRTGPLFGTSIACAYGSHPYANASLEVFLEAGVPYAIRVSHRSLPGFGGSLELRVHSASPAAPANDEPDTATPILDAPATFTQRVAAATASATDGTRCFEHPWVARQTVWFSLVAPRSTDLVFSTLGSGYDTVLAVEGPGEGGKSVGRAIRCNDDSASHMRTSRLRQRVEQGSSYLIQVSRACVSDQHPDGGCHGRSDLLRLSVSEGCAVQNDDRVDATSLTVVPSTIMTCSDGATAEPDEPVPCPQSGPLPWCPRMEATVWFRIETLTQGGYRSADTFGSSYEMRLAVWVDVGGRLERVAYGPGEIGTAQARVYWHQLPGATYLLQVGGYQGATGDLVVNLR